MTSFLERTEMIKDEGIEIRVLDLPTLIAITSKLDRKGQAHGCRLDRHFAGAITPGLSTLLDAVL